MAQSHPTAARRAWRSDALDYMGARTPPAGAGQGFYESSFDLREGLDVIECGVQLLPEDLASEFKRLSSRATAR